jgi:hypothetical protein
MEAKETEELLDWIAAEAGLEEVSFDLTTTKKCCEGHFSNRKPIYTFRYDASLFCCRFAFNFTYD